MIAGNYPLPGSQRPPEQGFGLGLPALVTEDRGQIAAKDGHLGIVRSSCPLPDVERPLEQALHMGVTGEVAIEDRQLVQAVCEVEPPRTILLFDDSRGAAEQGL